MRSPYPWLPLGGPTHSRSSRLSCLVGAEVGYTTLLLFISTVSTAGERWLFPCLIGLVPIGRQSCLWTRFYRYDGYGLQRGENQVGDFYLCHRSWALLKTHPQTVRNFHQRPCAEGKVSNKVKAKQNQCMAKR